VSPVWVSSARTVYSRPYRRFFTAFSSDGRAGRTGPETQSMDPAFKRVLMYLLVGTKGGPNRLQMIRLLQDEPMNANKMGERLGLDYKTIQHHLKILKENNVVVSNASGTYGAMYFLTPYVEKNLSTLEEIWARFGKR
jgi:DNA-binding transcriptional ArsR family regulator